MITLTLLFLLTATPGPDAPSKCSNSTYLMNRSREFHDPQGKWETADVKFYIAEPRIETPERFSEVHLNNANNSFSITRRNEEATIQRIVNAEGEAYILLNGSDTISDTDREKFGLDERHNTGYMGFYKTMYGLPMSLLNGQIARMSDAKSVLFNGLPAYEIGVELVKPVITDRWRVFLMDGDFRLLGVEIYSSSNAESDERLEFDGIFELDGIRIPRIRNWYNSSSDEYEGSDIIVKPID